MKSSVIDFKVLSLPLYEDYYTTASPTKLSKFNENTLIDCWNIKQLKTYRTRRYKPVNFTKLYKKIHVLKKQYQTPTKPNWFININFRNFSKNSLNISCTSSYLLRALNNSQLYKHQRVSCYKNFYFKGFTFDKEKVVDKKKRTLNHSLFFHHSTKLREKVLRQQTIERNHFLLA